MEKLTEEQKDRMAQRLSERMSLYYTAHPEEFRILCEGDRKGETKDGKLYCKSQDAETGREDSRPCF